MTSGIRTVIYPVKNLAQSEAAYPHLLGHEGDRGVTQLAAPAGKPPEPPVELQQHAEAELGRLALPGWFALPGNTVPMETVTRAATD